MHSSQRLITAIGEISDEIIEKAGIALGYRSTRRVRVSVRLSRWLGIAAVLMMVLSISIAAYPIWIHWSRGMEQRLPVSGEEQQYAKDSGLSESILFDSGDKEENRAVVSAAAEKANETQQAASACLVSSSVNGVTVSVEQTIIDSNSARIALRIEGFTLPDGEYPDIGFWELTFGGEQPSNMTGGFVESRDAADNLIFTDKRLLEYDFHAFDPGTDFSFIEKEICLKIESLGTGDKGQYEPMVNGPWELRWTPASNQESRIIQANSPVGDTGRYLLSAELAPVSAKVTLRLAELWEGYQTLEPFTCQLIGVKLKDGSEMINIFGPAVSEGYTDIDNLILQLNYSAHQIIHPERVDALLFAGPYPWAKELAEKDLIVVPVE